MSEEGNAEKPPEEPQAPSTEVEQEEVPASRVIDQWRLQYHRWVRYPDETEPVIERLVDRVTVEGKPRWLEIKATELYRTTVIQSFHLADGTDTTDVPGDDAEIEWVKTESGSVYHLGEKAPVPVGDPEVETPVDAPPPPEEPEKPEEKPEEKVEEEEEEEKKVE